MAYEKLKDENYLNLGGINEKLSDYATQKAEFLSLRNLGFTRPGALDTRPGQTHYHSTSLENRITGLYEFNRTSGFSQVIVASGSTLLSLDGASETVRRTDLGGSLLDFTTFVDHLWMADGQDYYKYNGTTVSQFSLPEGGAATLLGVTTTGEFIPIENGTYLIRLGYLNARGYIGPPSAGGGASLSEWAAHFTGTAMQAAILDGVTVPDDYAITAIVTWVQIPSSSDFVINQMFPVTNQVQVFPTNLDPPFNNLSTWPGYLHFTLAAKYTELYNNMLFMGGFDSLPSTTYYSELGEPEAVLPEYFLETRTNDGDEVTGYKAFQGSVLVFKEQSVHEVTGFSPTTLSQREVTLDYGCISNRAIVTFNNRLFFLDEKGIAEYNGVNTQIVSNYMEQTFKRMNIESAKENAVAIHVKRRNEVWFAIPLDDSTENNTVVVYDYYSNSWTEYDGFTVSSLAIIKGLFGNDEPFVGGYTGTVLAFGESYTSDNGATINCEFTTRYHKRLGDSTQELWRRFYLNANPTSSTQPVEVNFFANYATTSVHSATMFLDQFQRRIDFGESAKSMAVNVQFGTTEKVQINGYTIESRYLRSV